MSQEAKAIARSAELMAGSARAMQDVAEHISKSLEAQNVLFEGLIETMQKKSNGGGGGAFSGTGLGGLGDGVKKLAGGLGDLARILPQLVKGLSGFKQANQGSEIFMNFVIRMQEAIGKSTKDAFVPWSDFSKALDSMSGGLAKMSMGLFAFGVLTSDKINNRFVEFIGNLSTKFTEIDGKKMQEGADGLNKMSEAIFLFGVSLAASTVFYVVGAVGSLVIVPMVYGYSLLFEYLGKKSEDIEKGAGATLTMGLGILSMSLGIYAAKQLAGGDWSDYAEGSLIVLLSMAVFGSAFYFAGKYAKEIEQGSLAFIASGIGIASLALGIGVMMGVLPDLKTVMVAGLSVVTIGAALALIGSAASEIAFGALALIASGLGLASLALGLATFGYFKITWGEIAVAGASILGIGATMAAVGLAAPFIALGAASLMIAGVSMFVLAGGLAVFGLVYKQAESGLLAPSEVDGKTNLDVIIGGIVKAFSISPVDSAYMALGAGALMVASVSMAVLSLGIAVLNATYKTALSGLVAMSSSDPTKNNMEVLLGGIVKAFSISPVDSVLMGLGAVAFILAGAAMTTMSLGIFTLAKAYEHTGELFKQGDAGTKFEDMTSAIREGLALGPIKAAKLAMGSAGFISAGLALVSIALGVSRFSQIVEKNINMDRINDSITKILTSVVSGITGAYESTNWDTVKKGIGAVSDVGNLLRGIAEGVAKMAELKFPIYGADGKITGYFGIDDSKFGKVAENIKLIITCIGDALSEVGAKQGDTKWFSKSNAEKGAAAIRGVGQDLVGLADFVLKVADLRIPMLDKDGKVLEGRFVVIQPADLAEGGKVRQNIINIISAISSAFAAVGSGDSAKAGWFSKSDIEKGKAAITGVAADVSAMATSAKNIAEIQNFDNIGAKIKSIVVAFPQAVADAYNNVVKNLKGTSLADMAAQLSSVSNPVSGFIDVLAKYQDKKIQDKSGANLGSVISGVLASLNKPLNPASLTGLSKATDYIQKLATSADAIDKLAGAFTRMAKSIDVFAGAFKKMDKDVLKNSDMLIESFVTFSKVDPNALDTNSVKGKALLDFIYDKAKPAEQPTPITSIEPAVKAVPEQGIKPVESKPSTNRAAEAAAAQKQAALEDTLAQLQTTMAQLVSSMDAIKSVLTNPRGIKTQPS